MSEIEIHTQEILAKLKILANNPKRDIDYLYDEILYARKVHRAKQSESSRQYLRRAIRLFLHLYADIPDRRVIRIAFYYMRMFENERYYLAWLRRHAVGRDSEEFFLYLALYYESRGKYKSVIEVADEALNKKFVSRYLLNCRRRSQTALQMSVTESADEYPSEHPTMFFDVQFEELRYFSFLESEYFRRLETQNVNPFLVLGSDCFAISVMVDFLSPDKPFNVYYQHGQGRKSDGNGLNYVKDSNVIYTESLPLPRETAYRISYTERITQDIPERGDLIVNRDGEDVTVALLKPLGAGGFGRVVSARCRERQVAFKHFTRNKDCLSFENAASASFLREAYAFAFLSESGVKTLRFIAALIGPSGSGILMYKSSGLSLYDIMKTNMKYAKLNTPCFAEDQISDYFCQMMEIIRKVFQLNFVHCDCKIDNWMLNNDEVILIDFGKAINLKLFSRGRPVRFAAHTLNPVSPSPSCSPSWCFEADLCGLAACLFGLIQGRILTSDDIQAGKLEIKCCKYLARGEIYYLIARKLLFTRCDAETYSEYQKKAISVLDDAIALLKSG